MHERITMRKKPNFNQLCFSFTVGFFILTTSVLLGYQGTRLSEFADRVILPSPVLVLSGFRILWASLVGLVLLIVILLKDFSFKPKSSAIFNMITFALSLVVLITCTHFMSFKMYPLKIQTKHNQQVEPIVKTPVDEVEAQSTQAHP